MTDKSKGQFDNELDAKALILFERALKRPKLERETFIAKESRGDSALVQKTISLLRLDLKENAPILTGQAVFDEDEADLNGTQIGDYEITALIGKGGMGAVYRAKRRHGDFTHDVAVKVIRRGAASDALIARFMRERQILADMTHPNIARLFAGGTLSDDTPYFIMELIDGAPITDWADAQGLSPSSRLVLFLQACGPVKYAHQNLIIHRDITPNNVLVTQDGNVKFIDFGIAKPIAHANSDIPIASISTSQSINSLDGLTLTPGFAAPERSKGASPNTLSDIYSLGKLLDALLEDANPSADVLAIIKKATQTEPIDRYATVDALMQDVIAVQSNRPVTAYEGGPLYKFGKFVRRQKIATGLTALAVIAASVGYVNHNRAQTANMFAAERLSETREMTTFLLDELPENLRTIPGTLPVQRQVTEVSAKYLEVLSKAANNDPAVLFDYAMGHAQLGEILTVAGGANIGDTETGFYHFKESLKTLRTLGASNSENIDLQVALAETEYSYAYALMYHQGDLKAGTALLNSSIARFEALKSKVDSADVKYGHARARLLTLFFSVAGDFQNNKELISKIREDFEALLAEYPDDKDSIPQYASFLRNIAYGPFQEYAGFGTSWPLEQKDGFQQALKDTERSLELIEGLLLAEPTNTSHIYQYIWSAEVYILMSLVDKDWSLTFEDMVEKLAKDGAPYSPAELQTRLSEETTTAQDEATAKRIIELLDRGDKILAQISPYEADTFTHIEARYYNLKLHSYLQGRLLFDFEKAHEFNDKAKAMIDAFKEGDPDYRNAYLEDAITHNEKAYIYLLEQHLLGGNKRPLICNHLAQAKELWAYSEKRWGEIVDYGTDLEITQALITQTKCE